MKKRISFILSILLITSVFSGISYGKNRYAVLKLEGSVNPVSSEYLVESIAKANKDNMKFIVIQMDTPGGFLTSTRDIIKAIMSSKIPVVVYTYPKGAQAASAGGFIMLSSHVAVMSPGTEIGAMHPVNLLNSFGGGKEKGKSKGPMDMKSLNDTVAYARSLAQKRKRNVAWAEKAVKKAISSTYIEAVNAGVIDFVAEDMDDLLRKLNNRKVALNGRVVVIKTNNAVELKISMDWKQRLLNFFADPQIVIFLFLIAVAGIGFEFKNPGMIFPGAVGGAAFVIFLMAVRILPINLFGLALVTLAIVLFILELKITSYGLLTIGGIVSFVFGAMILFDSPLPGGYIPMTTIIATVVVLLAFIFIVVRAVLNVHKKRVTTGIEGLVGEVGLVIRDFTGKGKIKIHGEIWNAISEESISSDDEVVVTGVKRMNLIVKKNQEE